jgi:hypothetical protein
LPDSQSPQVPQIHPLIKFIDSYEENKFNESVQMEEFFNDLENARKNYIP